MSKPVVACALLLSLLSACDVTTLEDGTRRQATPSESSCIGALAAKISVGRWTVSATQITSVPEGDLVMLQTQDGNQWRCFAGLDGVAKTLEQTHTVTVPPIAAETGDTPAPAATRPTTATVAG